MIRHVAALGFALGACNAKDGASKPACSKEDALSCAADGKQIVVCRAGKVETYRYCRGQFGCAAKSDGPVCDESLSLPGDPCGTAGQLACSVDGKTELVCQGTTFAVSRTCDCKVVTSSGRHVDCN